MPGRCYPISFSRVDDVDPRRSSAAAQGGGDTRFSVLPLAQGPLVAELEALASHGKSIPRRGSRRGRTGSEVAKRTRADVDAQFPVDLIATSIVDQYGRPSLE